MPTLKTVLIRQAAMPMNFEKSLPVLPKVSQFMTQIAAALPVDPVLPEVPMMEAVPAFPTTNGFAQVIKGIEDALPVGVPKLSENLQAFTAGGYRPIEEKKVPKAAYRVMGGGYRSMS